jgi:hypothetical protein
VAFLWVNHIAFPLNLEAMELTVLQHLRRGIDGLPIYADPSPDFTALAYNPLYYFFAMPFASLFGATLFTLRLVAILGMLGVGLAIFAAVREATESAWWGLLAVGLFAAAYRAMDTYLDTAHADSWMVLTILLGCYLIAHNRSWRWDLGGVFLMVVAFWFKQSASLFALGAVLYLTWRDGVKRSAPAWILAVLLGPCLYLLVPDSVFGSRFHYFTWEVPRRWVSFDFDTVRRLVVFVARSYLLLAPLSLAAFLFAAQRSRLRNSIWCFMIPIAIVSGVTGAFDAESNDNVFISMGVWLIITGVIGLKHLLNRFPALEKQGLHVFALGASFALLLYNPMSVVTSSQAAAAYDDMVDYLGSLDGPVYAPWLGQLQDSYAFYPAVHWVPLTDLVRGPGVDLADDPVIRRLLDPAVDPAGSAYVLMNYPLEHDRALTCLHDRYALDVDLGDRFAPLKTLPRRFDLGWPRYLYRYTGE